MLIRDLISAEADMDFVHNLPVVAAGFLIWLALAVFTDVISHSDRFLAYMVTLLFCLTGSSEILLIKPAAFFFTVGGTFAFVIVLFRSVSLLLAEEKDDPHE